MSFDKHITVVTPANIEITYRLAGAGSRLAAFIVDFLLQLAACLILAAIVLFGFSGLRFETISNAGGLALGFLLIACFAILSGYYIVCEMVMNGQSIGKKLFGLRVIRDNGQPVEFTQSLIRNIFRIALDMLYVGLFIILFSKKNKRFGDMAAGTVVVSEHYADISASPANHFPKAAIDMAARFPHIRLTEEEIRLLNGYLSRKENLPDHGLAIREKLTRYLAKKWQIDAKLLDDEVLSMLADG